MAETVTVTVKPGSRKGPLVEAGEDGTLTVYVRDPAVDGKANTAALVAHGGHPVAEWAASYEANGLTDFYLPSRLELLMCYLAAPQLFKKEGYYWSSSQFSRGSAWCQGFEDGGSNGTGKDNELRARPVRTIQL